MNMYAIQVQVGRCRGGGADAHYTTIQDKEE